jgi:hypothetical protein
MPDAAHDRDNCVIKSTHENLCPQQNRSAVSFIRHIFKKKGVIMTTVALRGTLIHCDDEHDGGRGGSSWQWKGMWAFGSSLATAAAQSQQPFLYSFQHATDPSEIAMPGILVVEEAMAGTAEENEAEAEAEAVDEGEGEATTAAGGGEDTKTSSTTTGTAASGENKSEQQKEQAQEAGQTAPATDDKDYGDSKEKTAAAAPQSEDEAAGAASSQHKEDTDTDTTKSEQSETKQPPAPPPTFASVLEGCPAFTDACQKYPETPCPVSGQWKGYFQNMAGSRPRDKIQKVQETFYLFFNATPGPDVRYVFDDTPLPPTVRKESLVLVRGKYSTYHHVLFLLVVIGLLGL